MTPGEPSTASARSGPLTSAGVALKEVIGIQYLRAIAALSVVVFHSLLYVVRPAGPTPFAISLMAGGVDLFFVISGFIIWRSTSGRDLRPLAWWASRLIRIVPLYWLTLTVSLALLTFHEGRSIPSLEVLRAYAFVPGFDSRTGELAPFFVPGWTLDYEFLFYALMAGVLVFKAPAVRLGVLVTLLGALVAMRRTADPHDAVAMAFSSPLLFEFVGGIGVAILWQRVATPGRGAAPGAASILVAAVLLAWVSPRLYEHAPRAVYFGVPAVLIVFGVACLESWLRRRPIEMLKSLGDASYSLYLGHEFVLYGALAAMAAWPASQGAPAIGVGVAACALFGVFIHRVVERPLLAACRRAMPSAMVAPRLALARRGIGEGADRPD